MKSILFVCLGNICRSPLAEGVFNEIAAERGYSDEWKCDSCGTGGWHAGELPDPRMRATARRHGIELTHRARQICAADYSRFDMIIAMDEDNLRIINQHRPATATAECFLLRRFDPEKSGKNVPDPYYGGDEGFEEVYQIVRRSLDKFADELEEKE